MECYLLVEGINIGANLYDTNQLSIVRGGSFLLKQAVVDIKNHWKDHLEVISEGASSGVFKCKSSSSRLADIRKEIVDWLSGHERYSLLTFGVETCEAENVQAAKEQLLTQLRLHQLQGATLVPDSIQGDSRGPSDWSGVRALDATPQTVTYYPPGQNPDIKQISSSEKRRWTYGREQKQSYYLQESHYLKETKQLFAKEKQQSLEDLIAQLEEYYFTRDLNELSSGDQFPDLSGKIAVFYADGNSFGKLQQALLKEEGDKDAIQKAFDTTLQYLRREFLADAMEEMLDGRFPEMKTTTRIGTEYKDALRFETLLWGGDEMLFVMPAWIGFDFVQFFFEKTANWEIMGQPLTHSAGLVLCSAKTPIRITRQLAQLIADHVKHETDKDSKGKRNAWDYMVLESIDYPTRMDFTDFCKKRYHAMAAHRPLCIEPGGDWQQQAIEIKEVIENNLPTRQLYKIAHALVTEGINVEDEHRRWPPTTDDPRPLEALEQRLLAVSEDKTKVKELISRLGAILGLNHDNLCQRAWIWLHLVELKDYLAPRRAKA